ncbi:hypothetical protein ES703_57212 [subsurface metagenome]
MPITLEKEGLRLRVLKEALPPGVQFGEFMREVMGKAATRQAVDYGKNVADWIVVCRVDGGLPMFKTRFAGERYPEGHVLAVCWAGRGLIEGQWFKDVPSEDVELMESKHGEWKDILGDRGTSEQVEKAMKSPLILTFPPEGLPPRGTGLETGRAGERRAGVPRTEEERRIRHLGADSSKNPELPLVNRWPVGLFHDNSDGTITGPVTIGIAKQVTVSKDMKIDELKKLYFGE